MAADAPSPKKPGLTPDQRRGVETVGKSLLMSAAAGSGKTRVLAERCAYLVCDARPPVRCDVDELLVVTFTEKAAAEMRERIGKTLRDRLAAKPDNRLAEQVALVDQAQISTLHSFCSQLLRQHFHLVGLDPGFGVMDAHEGTLLRLDVGRDLLRRRYAEDVDGRFQRLLDAYFDGDDERLLREVLRVYDLTQSLIDPPAWIGAAIRRAEEAAEKPLLKCELGRDLVELVRRRITGLGQRCNTAMALLQSFGGFDEYEERVREVYQSCRYYYKLVEQAGIDAVAEEVASVEFKKLKPIKNTVPNKELAKEALDGVVMEFKKGPWRNLLRFTEAQWRDGMAKVVPHVHELLELVVLFGDRYRQAKDDNRQLDFSDLERYALRVLREEGQPGLRPSPAARYYHRAFKQVLVDEYQDINELQNAILRLVSHECLNERAEGGGQRAGEGESVGGDDGDPSSALRPLPSALSSPPICSPSAT